MFYIIHHKPTDTNILNLPLREAYQRYVYYRFLDGRLLTEKQKLIQAHILNVYPPHIYRSMDLANQCVSFIVTNSRTGLTIDTFNVIEADTWPLERCHPVQEFVLDSVALSDGDMYYRHPYESLRMPAARCTRCNTTIPNGMSALYTAAGITCPLCLDTIAQRLLQEYEEYPCSHNKQVFEEMRVIGNL